MRKLAWVGVLTLAGAVLFSAPERGRADNGLPGHLSHMGYYNPHAYQSPYLFYPFHGGSYPWYNSRPYYGWRFPSSSTEPPKVEPPKVERPKPDNIAHITVKLPADAEIWFDGTKMAEAGPIREFHSPPLTPGLDYSYQVRARWQKDGRTITQTREVVVAAGSRINVDFTSPGRTEK